MPSIYFNFLIQLPRVPNNLFVTSHSFVRSYQVTNLSDNFSYVDLLRGGKACPVGSKFQIGNLSQFTFLLVETVRDTHVWLNNLLFARHLGSAYNRIQFAADEAYYLRGSYDGEYITITENGNSQNSNTNIWSTIAIIGIKLNL